jgi:arylsulfatase A-like enzyme
VRADGDDGPLVTDREVEERSPKLDMDLGALGGRAAMITFAATKGEVVLRDASLFASAAHPKEAPGEVRAKNFVLVLIDTLRADKIDLYNKETRVRAPFVSGLGQAAMVFDRAFAPENWTKPSVASLLTGLYPETHRTKDDRDKLPATVTTIQEHLKSLGFVTAGFVANGYISGKFGFRRGWDSWTNYVREGKANRAEFVVRDAINWLEKRADDRPFFLYVHTIDPHVPYIPPRKYLKMYDAGAYDGPVNARDTAKLAEKIKTGQLNLNERDKMRFEALYDGEITYHDDQLVRLEQKLKALGRLDDTLVIVTSDHGEEFFDHGRVGHGHSLYEELLHVPLLIRLPGDHRKGEARCKNEVSLVDIFPTACDILAVECPAGMEGASLVPLLEGKGWPHFPSVAFSDFLESQRAARMGRYKLILRGFRTTLFDLATDPGETEDLSDERPFALAMLFDAMGSHLGRLARPLEGAGAREKGPRHKAAKATIDPETRRQLRALGYLVDDE